MVHLTFHCIAAFFILATLFKASVALPTATPSPLPEVSLPILSNFTTNASVPFLAKASGNAEPTVPALAHRLAQFANAKASRDTIETIYNDTDHSTSQNSVKIMPQWMVVATYALTIYNVFSVLLLGWLWVTGVLRTLWEGGREEDVVFWDDGEHGEWVRADWRVIQVGERMRRLGMA